MSRLELLEYLPEDLFDGTVVFITGGGSGINLGIARAFASLGADLAICGRSAERLETAAAELEDLGAQVVAVPADVRDYDAVAHGVEVARDELGPIGVLVCGAAGNFPCMAEDLSANSIAPGPIEGTEGMRRLGPDDPSYHDRLKKAIPLGRYGTVEEIGAAAVYLASPMAAYITGTLLVVDGGQNLAGSCPFGDLLDEAMKKR